MKRRSFFSGFLKAAAAVAVASSIEVFGALETIKTPASPWVRINPAYLTAQFEEQFISISTNTRTLEIRDPKNYGILNDASEKSWAPRFNLENGEYVYIPKYIQS